MYRQMKSKVVGVVLGHARVPAARQHPLSTLKGILVQLRRYEEGRPPPSEAAVGFFYHLKP